MHQYQCSNLVSDMSYRQQTELPTFEDCSSHWIPTVCDQDLFVDAATTATSAQTQWRRPHNIGARPWLDDRGYAKGTCPVRGCFPNAARFAPPSSTQRTTPIQNVCISSTSTFTKNEQNGCHENSYKNAHPTLQTTPAHNTYINTTSAFARIREGDCHRNQFRNQVHSTASPKICTSSTCPAFAQSVRPDYRQNRFSNVRSVLRSPPNQDVQTNSNLSTYAQNNRLTQFVNTSCMYGSNIPLLPIQNHTYYKESPWAAAPLSLYKNSKKKRTRTAFKIDQLVVLEKIFSKRPYISKGERRILSRKLDLSDKSIKVWFQNRRIKEKKDDRLCDNYNESDPSSSEESLAINTIMDEIEREIQQPAENGLVKISDKALRDLYMLVNPFLPEDLSLINAVDTSETSPVQSLLEVDSTVRESKCSDSEEQRSDIVGDYSTGQSTNSVESSNQNQSLCRPIYEPISPAPTDDEDYEVGCTSNFVSELFQM